MNVKLLTETGATLWEVSNIKKIIFNEDSFKRLEVFFIDSKGDLQGFPFKKEYAQVEYIFATDTFLFHLKSPTLDMVDEVSANYEELSEEILHIFDKSFERLVEKESIPPDDDELEKEDQRDLRHG